MWEIETYVKLFFRWLWLLLVGAAAGAAAAYLILDFQGLYPQYQTTATITVGTQLDANVVSQEELNIGTDLVPNYVVLAERPPITDAVIENLGLEYSQDKLVTYHLDVTQEGQTRVVLITGKDPDPEIAAAIANETAVQMQLTGPTRPTELIQIVALAKVPENPSTEPLLIIVLAGLAGFSFFALIAAVIELKRDRPRTVSWAASRLQLPVLGAFASSQQAPLVRRLTGKVKPPAEWGPPAPVWWAVMETFERALELPEEGRALRRRGRVLVVTSPDNSQSKAIAALELARTWATTGARVVLVDADPSHSSLHRLFRVGNEAGITTMISPNGRVEKSVDKMLINSHIENLFLLPSGPQLSGQSAMLFRLPWQEAVSTLTQKGDVVIINSPAVEAGPEAILPASQASGVLLVMDLGKTSAGDTNEASDLLAKSGSRVLGAVVNRG